MWFIDNERPLRVFYFNNEYSQIIALDEKSNQFDKELCIDKILLVGKYKIFEVEVRSGSYYRSYNEDMEFEWDCFAYEINKAVQHKKKSINEAKFFEAERRFDLSAKSNNLERINNIKR